eukprot:scaffold241_cov340-Pavlova_lutheri.AAC.1
MLPRCATLATFISFVRDGLQPGGSNHGWGSTPPPLFLHRERGGVAVGSVEPRVDLSRRCSSNRSCRALRVE